MSGPHDDWDPGDLRGLEASSNALTRTVDALAPDDYAAPSLLPGWSRAHVVAHVALAGLALAGVVEGAVRGRVVAMYESDEQRDADIEELAGAGPSVLRERYLESVTAFADAVQQMEEEHWSGRILRLPGGPAWPIVTLVPTRRREVEVHHADLGAGYDPADWPEDFVVELLDVVTVDHAGSGPFLLRATDLGREWTVGEGSGPSVTGTGAALGWWLTGRGGGEGLVTDAEALPELGAWRRAAATPDRR
jgi:maleylpyruvate isomerase